MDFSPVLCTSLCFWPGKGLSDGPGASARRESDPLKEKKTIFRDLLDLSFRFDFW